MMAVADSDDSLPSMRRHYLDDTDHKELRCRDNLISPLDRTVSAPGYISHRLSSLPTASNHLSLFLSRIILTHFRNIPFTLSRLVREKNTIKSRILRGT